MLHIKLLKPSQFISICRAPGNIRYSNEDLTQEAQKLAHITSDGLPGNKVVLNKYCKELMSTDEQRLEKAISFQDYQVGLVKSCNYSCKNCIAYCTNVYDEAELTTDVLIKRCKFANKIIKMHMDARVPKASSYGIGIGGGEITLYSADQLKQGFKELFSSLPYSSNISITTNLSCTSSELSSILKDLSKYGYPTLAVSFHDATLATKSARQAFFSKVLKLSDWRPSYVTTVSKTNQQLIKSLLGLARWYNVGSPSFLPLRPLEDLATGDIKFTKGFYAVENSDTPTTSIDGIPCNGVATTLLTSFMMENGKDLVQVLPTCCGLSLNTNNYITDGNGHKITSSYMGYSSTYRYFSEELLPLVYDQTKFFKCNFTHSCQFCGEIQLNTAAKPVNLHLKNNL